MNEQTLVAACQEHAFVVAVIGQAVSPKEKLRVLSLIRKHCRLVQVLELYPASTGRIRNCGQLIVSFLQKLPHRVDDDDFRRSPFLWWLGCQVHNRGGSFPSDHEQSGSSDGRFYVTKFSNNPQHPRILANEMLASRLGQWLGLPNFAGYVLTAVGWSSVPPV